MSPSDVFYRFMLQHFSLSIVFQPVICLSASRDLRAPRQVLGIDLVNRATAPLSMLPLLFSVPSVWADGPLLSPSPPSILPNWEFRFGSSRPFCPAPYQ